MLTTRPTPTATLIMTKNGPVFVRAADLPMYVATDLRYR
jgi:hypothetical protein